MNDSGNSVLITGGATGIGFAMARAFRERGNRVLICSRRSARLEQAKDRLPGLEVMTCDVSVAKEREALLRWAIDTAAGLNILVNNAGIQRDIDFMQGIAEYEAGPSEIAINLEALVVLSALFIPHLAKQKNPAIVNVSSGLGFVPAARMPVYSATKAAVHAFSMALRHQLKAVGIEIYEVVPPAVDTELNTEGRAKRGGFRAGLGADEFVAAVMKGMASGRVEIGYGTTERSIKASREELDESFERMNGRW